MDPSVTAFRFVHGKIVSEPGGPVTPGFEHQATSINQGTPEGLWPFCRLPEVLGNRSVQALVHPQRERDGALLFSPACCDGRRYMLATCVRARPESGEGGLSRTHTQLTTFIFTEADWNVQAPRLIANAGGWLRTEPDTVAVHEQYRDHGGAPPIVLRTEDLPEVPPCAAGPLPKTGSLLWRLTGALEKADETLVCGAADRIDSVGTFLRALACVVALLPEPLRIYLTAAAGFAAVQDPTLFALQYLPEAPALPRSDPGLFEQLAGQLVFEDPAADQDRWQRCWRPGAAGDLELAQVAQALAAPAAWQTAVEARGYLGRVFDGLIASRSVTDLEAWLDGKRSAAPARPTSPHHDTGTRWIQKLTQSINHSKPCGGLARALVKVATLIDATAPPQEQARQADYWARAWREAAAPVHLPRWVLRWSALSTSRLADDPADARPRALGYLKDFRELRVIAETMQRAKAESPADAVLVDQALGNESFSRRLDDLRRRADDLLIRQPLGIIDLAASFPALLATRPADDSGRAASLAQTLRAILIAARLADWTGAQAPGPPGLADATRRVAERSLKLDLSDAELRRNHMEHGEEDFRALLRRYWQWALTPGEDRDPDCGLWLDGVALALTLRAAQQGPSTPLRWLFDHAQRIHQEAVQKAEIEHGDRTTIQPGIQPGIEHLVKAVIAAVVPLDAPPARAAAELFRAVPDLSLLAPEQLGEILTFDLAEAIDQTIARALQDPRTGAPELMAAFLPVFSDTIGDWLAKPANTPTKRLTRRLLALAKLLFERLFGAGRPLPRQPVTELFDRLELLVTRTSARREDLATDVQPLGLALAHCILGWAQADPPEPWLDAHGTLAQAPIRLALARLLGFPRCAYFAALTAAHSEDPQVKGILASTPRTQWRSAVEVLGLRPEAVRSIDKVIAYGAATAWRGLFNEGFFERNDLKRLLGEPASEEALDALATLAQDRETTYRRLIDEETWFTVAFFASLGEDHSPLGHWPIPGSLRATLLSNGSRQNECYALQLGRRIATSASRIGGYLEALFAPDDSNCLIARRVLLLFDQGWDGFAYLRSPEREQALLRLLFLFGLIMENNRDPKATQGRLLITRRETVRALQLAPAAPAAKGAMDGFFRGNPDFADAFRQAIEAANMPRLTGWPDCVQPSSSPTIR